MMRSLVLVSMRFQSTLPVWGATVRRRKLPYTNVFQSTLPVWGATPLCMACGPSPLNFNPRSPCGERPGRSSCRRATHDFNPRSPCGERLDVPHVLHDVPAISIHAPRVGSDRQALLRNSACLSFQSTLPVWGATHQPPEPRQLLRISIHAPRVGSDDQREMQGGTAAFQSTLPVWGATRLGKQLLLLGQFQSTLPVWGATICRLDMYIPSPISIHAPRVGSDPVAGGQRQPLPG